MSRRDASAVERVAAVGALRFTAVGAAPALVALARDGQPMVARLRRYASRVCLLGHRRRADGAERAERAGGRVPREEADATSRTALAAAVKAAPRSSALAHAGRNARAAAAAASRALGHVATCALPARIARASVGADALAVSAARLVADGFGAIGARPARRTSASVGAHTRPTTACTRAVVQAAWLAARGAAVALVAAAHVGNEAPAVPPAVEAVGNLARIARVPRGARASTPIAIAHAVGRAVVRAAHPNRAIGAAPAGRAQALAIVAVATSRAVVCAQAR